MILKLSDTFSKFLFTTDHKTIDETNVRELIWSDVEDFLTKTIVASEKEYSHQLFHKTKKNIMVVEKNRIDIISKFGDVDGVIYGILDEEGPRLILEWKTDKPRDSSVKIAKIFMRYMKKYNNMVSNISSLNAAKQILNRPVGAESHRRNTRVHPSPVSGGRRRTPNQTRRRKH